VLDGRQAKDYAAALLERSGFVDVRADVKRRELGIEIGFLAADRTGRAWAFDVTGGFTTARTGLRRADTLWKALGRAAVLHLGDDDLRLVLLTTDLPARGTAGAVALDNLRGPGRPIADVVELLDPAAEARLAAYAGGESV
jgi:hypothetical protein